MRKKLKWKLYKIERIESNNYPTIEFITNLSCENGDLSLEGTSFIIQSMTKGNLIIGYYNRKTIELYFKEDDEI